MYEPPTTLCGGKRKKEYGQNLSSELPLKVLTVFKKNLVPIF